MRDNDNNIDFSRLRIDPTIRPLAVLNDTGYVNHLRACQCFSQWTKGYSEEQIALFFAISVADVEADLAHIKTLYTQESFQVKLKEREEILRLIEKEKNMPYKLSEDLSVSADALLKRGQNPGKVLKKLREELTAEDPNLIADLREQNRQASINEDSIDLAPEAAYRIIRELREKEKKPAQKVMTISRSRQEPKSASPEQSIRTTNDLDQKLGENRTDLRITFRLNPGLYEKLQKHSQDIGLDISAVIRAAVTQYIDSDATSQDKANLSMPAEALALIGPFQVWGSDIREELRLRFLKMLAMAHVTMGRWPKTKWVKELYMALLPLYQFLETDGVRQS
jgi:hypothetical protein